MLLDTAQLHEIRQIIADYHDAFIVNAIDPEAVAPEILEKLKEAGLVEVEISSIEDAYLYGQLVGILQNPKVAGMSYAEFKTHLRKNPIPLSAVEKQAVKMAAMNAGQYCKGLGNKVNLETGAVLIEADQALRAKMETTIKTATAENIAKRQSIKKLRSDMGWATKDWTRDWTRIAVTEKNNAMQHGAADHYRKQFGEDAFVSKRAMPDACQHCKRLYTGPDGQPRIFKLSSLEANGTNVGRKVADWLAVVGTTHPNCQCQIVRVPAGWGYDEEGSMVPGGEFGIKYEDEGELQLAMLAEMDLEKAFKLQDHVEFQGLSIAVENKAGSVRKWKAANGESGETVMRFAYGYVKRTNGMDEDEIDVFVGPDPKAAQVYVVDQQNPYNGMYDEQKCMLGFSNQVLAERAYREHFDRPDFLVTVNPMDMDHFKRWIGETLPAKGEMLKGGPVLRLVIPTELETSCFPEFQKSPVNTGRNHDPVLMSDTPDTGRGSNLIRPGSKVIPLPRDADPFQKGRVPAYVGAANSPAGDRAPGPGLGVNYFILPPKKKKGEDEDDKKKKKKGYSPSAQDMVAVQQRTPLKRDKKIYEVEKPVPVVPKTMEVPKDYHGGDAARAGSAERKAMVNKKYVINLGRPKNTAELKKAKKHQPVIAIGEQGGKIVKFGPGGKKVYQTQAKPVTPWTPDKGHWATKLVKNYGGKIVPDTSDKTKVVLKIPNQQKDKLKAFQKKFSPGGKVFSGKTYTMLSMSKTDWNALAKLKLQTPMKKGKPPKFASESKRRGKFKEKDQTTIPVPPIDAKFMQRGQKVKAKLLNGKHVNGAVVGHNVRNQPIVRYGDKEEPAEWPNVEAKTSEPYVPTPVKLAAEDVLEPDERQRKLMRETIDKLKVVGSHTTREYVEALWENGQEVFVVGGLVRDLLAGTVDGSKETDPEILKKMADVDLVTPGSPQAVAKIMAKVSKDLPGSVDKKSMPWATLRSTKSGGAGLDVVCMVQSGSLKKNEYNEYTGVKEPPIILDHELVADATRRDFTCNAVYYDAVNDALIDPTSHGIADAQNKVLRLACSEEDMNLNTTLSLRYFKFRMRGYTPVKETYEAMTGHFETWGKKSPKSRGSGLYRTFGAKGGKMEDHLETLRVTMKADGLEHLYEQYIEADKTAILKQMYKRAKENSEAKKAGQY